MKKVIAGVFASTIMFSMSAWGGLIDITKEYSSFTSEGFTAWNSDAAGRIAAGGDISLSNYSVGAGFLNADYSLISGGDVTLNGGTVYTGVYAKADFTNNGGTVNGAIVSNNAAPSPINFNATTNELISISQQIKEMDVTGTVKKPWNGGLELVGTGNAGFTVFNLDASDLNPLYNFSLVNMAADEIALINISGTTINFLGQNGWGINKPENVLFNFTDATKINLNGSFAGSILAMSADIIGSYGAMDGGIYAKSFSGSQEFHLHQFNNNITTVPEASSLILLFTGLLALVPSYRRFKK